jgi:hypothetical protein
MISGEADSASEIQVTLPDRLETHRNNETAEPSPQPHLRPSHPSPSGRGAVGEGHFHTTHSGLEAQASSPVTAGVKPGLLDRRRPAPETPQLPELLVSQPDQIGKQRPQSSAQALAAQTPLSESDLTKNVEPLYHPQLPLPPANRDQSGPAMGANISLDTHWSQSLPRRGIERRTSTPPTTRVNIGRIEVRPAPPPEPPAEPAKSPRRSPGLSLGEYLKQRRGTQS